MSLKNQLQTLGVSSESLDDAIHQAASQLASNANNDGLGNQLDFLTTTCGWSDQNVLDALVADSVIDTSDFEINKSNQAVRFHNDSREMQKRWNILSARAEALGDIASEILGRWESGELEDEGEFSLNLSLLEIQAQNSAAISIVADGREQELNLVNGDTGTQLLVPDYLVNLQQEFADHASALKRLAQLSECIKLWIDLGDKPLVAGSDGEDVLDSSWHVFDEGATRESVWHWFEEKYNCSVGADLIHVPINASWHPFRAPAKH